MSSILSKLINLAGNITGVLPVANGGTNSSTSLNNNRFIVSSGSAIAEAAAVTASRVVVSDGNGLPSAATTTTTQVQYLASATGTTGTTSTNLVFSTSPTLVTPVLGTPASGTLTNCTGYPIVVPGTSSGAVSSSGLTGNTGASAIAAGFVGETIYAPSNKVTAYSALTTATILNITSNSITAGKWMIYASVTIKQTNNAFVPTSSFDFTVSSVGNNSMTGCNGNNLNIDYGSLWPRANATNTVDSGTLSFPFETTSTKTLFLNVLISFSGGTASASGAWSAIRIA